MQCILNLCEMIHINYMTSFYLPDTIKSIYDLSSDMVQGPSCYFLPLLQLKNLNTLTCLLS